MEHWMHLKRAFAAGVLAAGLGVAGLGMGVAAADPGQPCGGPNQRNCQQQGPGQGPQDNRGQGQDNRMQDDYRNRNIDQGRQDHRPFNYLGQQVNPVWDQGHNGWGFWFLNNWIPL
jgi:hypothetical protein